MFYLSITLLFVYFIWLLFMLLLWDEYEKIKSPKIRKNKRIMLMLLVIGLLEKLIVKPILRILEVTYRKNCPVPISKMSSVFWYASHDLTSWAIVLLLLIVGMFVS